MTIGYVDYVIVSGWTKGWAHCETKIVKIPNDINHEEIFLDICEQIYGENAQQTKSVNQIADGDKLKPYLKNSDESFKVKTAEDNSQESCVNVESKGLGRSPDKTKVFLKRYNPKLWKKKKKDEIFRTALGKSYFKTPQEVKDIRKGLNKLRKIK